MFKTMIKTRITLQKILEIIKVNSLYVNYILCEGYTLPQNVNVHICYTLQMQNRMLMLKHLHTIDGRIRAKSLFLTTDED